MPAGIPILKLGSRSPSVLILDKAFANRFLEYGSFHPAHEARQAQINLIDCHVYHNLAHTVTLMTTLTIVLQSFNRIEGGSRRRRSERHEGTLQHLLHLVEPLTTLFSFT